MHLLASLPDPQKLSFEELMTEADLWLTQLRQTRVTPAMIEACQPLELDAIADHPCGVEASATWRRFFLATLLADWACYDAPSDRVDYARLKFIMTSAYRYFRVWFMPMPNGDFLPVGYTGWYPIAKFVFDGLRNHPDQIDDRGLFMPLRYIAREDIRYAYAFNISILPQLKNTSASRRMLHAYIKDKEALGNIGFAAITVGADGAKFSKLSKLKDSGTITVHGEKEILFLKEPQ